MYTILKECTHIHVLTHFTHNHMDCRLHTRTHTFKQNTHIQSIEYIHAYTTTHVRNSPQEHNSTYGYASASTIQTHHQQSNVNLRTNTLQCRYVYAYNETAAPGDPMGADMLIKAPPPLPHTHIKGSPTVTCTYVPKYTVVHTCYRSIYTYSHVHPPTHTHTCTHTHLRAQYAEKYTRTCTPPLYRPQC